MKRFYNVDQNIVYFGKYRVLVKLDEFHNIVTILWNQYSSIPFDVLISQLTRRMMNISLAVHSIFLVVYIAKVCIVLHCMDWQGFN